MFKSLLWQVKKLNGFFFVRICDVFSEFRCDYTNELGNNKNSNVALDTKTYAGLQ